MTPAQIAKALTETRTTLLRICASEPRGYSCATYYKPAKWLADVGACSWRQTSFGASVLEVTQLGLSVLAVLDKGVGNG